MINPFKINKSTKQMKKILNNLLIPGSYIKLIRVYTYPKEVLNTETLYSLEEPLEEYFLINLINRSNQIIGIFVISESFKIPMWIDIEIPSKNAKFNDVIDLNDIRKTIKNLQKLDINKKKKKEIK